ncbi:MAG: CCA tRNA nucleotidyltransferase [Dehalococcoidales bacterium]|nr:CCA tRNA nucleotidyltransferase [Dehalococcoidales bacterium]
MNEHTNLPGLIEKNLPKELVALMQRVATLAARRNQTLYLVGGVVRDLLLGLPNLDLDFVVEGDAIGLAKELAQSTGGKLTTHTRFNTAKLRLDKWSLDLVTARSETYARPGALPTVKPGSLKDDLLRRDFTINAMSIRLTPERYGELVDLYGGHADLRHKLIRILHEKSFSDDATRIWRAIRYEQRLDFQIEPETLRLLKRDIPMLDTISGDRIRHELELELKEEYPEKMLHRAWILKALGKIHSSLKGDTWLQDKFLQARATASSGQELAGLYFALLTYRLTEQEVEEIIAFLRPTRQTAIILRDSSQLQTVVKELAQKGLQPAHIYSILHGYHHTALLTNYIAFSSATARNAINIKLYLEKLRFVKTALTGDDLQAMGIPPGPQMQELLVLLHNARLNGEVRSRQEEEALVREWLKE